jgi:hypothetical protein
MRHTLPRTQGTNAAAATAAAATGLRQVVPVRVPWMAEVNISREQKKRAESLLNQGGPPIRHNDQTNLYLYSKKSVLRVLPSPARMLASTYFNDNTKGSLSQITTK